MEVIWRDVDLLDGDGRVTAAGQTLLHQEMGDERVAIVTLLGSRATSPARRRLVAQMLGHTQSLAAKEVGPGAGVTLLACASYMDEDYRLLVLDVGDASSPLIGSLCTLSSLVLSAGDSDTAVANALPAFPPFQESLELLQREHSAIEIYDMLPTMLTVDFSSDGSLQRLSSPANHASSFSSSLSGMTRLKTLAMQSAETIADIGGGSFFASNAPVKRAFGRELRAEVLLSLLQTLARDVAEGHEPDVSSSWDEYVEGKCTAVAEDALATYTDCIQSSLDREAPPIELEAFEKLNDELWRLAMDVFQSGVGDLNAASRRAVRDKLKADLKRKWAEELQALRENSRRFCDRVRSQLWRELSTPLLEEAATGPELTNSSHAFRAALEAIRQFDAAYDERAKGPEKTAVLCEFHQHEAVEIYRHLESIVSQKMTDTHLRELRKQLETDFEAKKDALVEHFKQEEAQLRVCMAREMEMMQKLHQAKNSRTKIDESETKRLREELNELRNAKSALESKQIVLEHAAQHATEANTTLDAKVRDLERAVRQEMASRTELVDTLATTIAASEEKERQLHERIAELQIDVNEKASRIENELRELTVQLRKTTEEKEELQKKLNEFFLRVTSLPPAMQQHLFCLEPGEDKEVGFADALSSYMGA